MDPLLQGDDDFCSDVILGLLWFNQITFFEKINN